jgi:hypothetical protein
VFNTGSTSLRGKLTPAMTRHIRLQRESGEKGQHRGVRLHLTPLLDFLFRSAA